MGSGSASMAALQPTTLPSSFKSFSPAAPTARRLSFRPIAASAAEEPLIAAPDFTATLPEGPPLAAPGRLPVREVPGSHGLPVIGAFKDRQDYFYNQGADEFFRSRMRRYGSTVFRTNMPPGALAGADSRVVALLDGRSFPVLFDTSKVEKRDLFTGTFMPSTAFTGGHRVLSYLDPSEPNHGRLKELLLRLIRRSRGRVIPEFRTCYGEVFDALEGELATNGAASFAAANDQAAFNFLARSLFGRDPRDTALERDGPDLIGKWLLFQLSPVITLGLPRFVEELTLRAARLPAALVKKEYRRLYDFFWEAASEALEDADELGVPRGEACHNLLFATCFNSFGGLRVFFPNLLKLVAGAGAAVHARLAEEVRAAVCGAGGSVTPAAMERMPLAKSVVCEALRIEPPVAQQYGRARRDMVVESHVATFRVRAGEVLLGYQPLATRDPAIFERAEEFVAERFVGVEGERLLRHVFWSNGPESEAPTAGNKQCAGKDLVVLAARLLVAELFLRYDSFDVEVGSSAIGAAVNLTSLKRATS